MDTDKLKYRMAQKPDTPAVLSFVKEMGFNERSEDYWTKNRLMAAICVSNDGRIIGVIPIAPRSLFLGEGNLIPVWHQTVVAVRPEFRSLGIGTKLQCLLQNESVKNKICMMTVYRHGETTNAYQWYSKNGFEDILPIRSLTIQAKKIPHDKVSEFGMVDISTCSASLSDLENRLEVTNRTTGCGVHKDLDILVSDLDTVSPYSTIYKLFLAQLELPSGLLAYAIVGIGKLHSSEERVEILLLRQCQEKYAKSLIENIISYAHDFGYNPVRIAVSKIDPILALLSRIGFTDDWGFKFRAHLVDLDMLLNLVGPKNLDICFRVANYGDYSIHARSRSVLTLSYSQYLLLMLFRLDLDQQIDGGFITYEGSSDQYDLLSKHFEPKPWLFMGIDYC